MTIARPSHNLRKEPPLHHKTVPVRLMLAGVATGLLLIFTTGCETVPASATASPTALSTPAEIQAWQDAGRLSDILRIREGDGLKVSFPGAPKLDAVQQVRADGVITLELVGEVKVVGLTPKELEKKLADLYSTQLVSNEVTVSVTSSTFDVFVSGEVLRPGKITTSKPITALQAIMEAGYNAATANLENVRIIRETNGKYSYLTLNLQLILEGRETNPFYLRPSDTVMVYKRVKIFT